MGRTVSSSSSGAAFRDERFTDFYFDDAVIFVETMEVLVASLGVLSKESESLGLWVSWVKTEIQNFIQTWTLTDDLKRRLDSFGTGSLRKILGYQWFKSNDRLLEETSMKISLS